MEATLYDDRVCGLGEGPLWHPLRQHLIWFDILGRRLLWREGARARAIAFDELASAAGWVSETALLVATETRLLRLDLESGAREDVCALEADDPATRSNDGRADPWGGFWIGTMKKSAPGPGSGALYRWYRGTLRRLHAPLPIPNAICFAPDRRWVYFADTTEGAIRRQPLDLADGWPTGPSEVFIDLRGDGLNPDGAVCDAEGRLWNAQWGAGRVACYGPDGAFLRAVAVPARHSSCPAFGGAEMRTLYITSATQDLAPDAIAAEPQTGCTFAAEDVATGLPEPQVIL